jgi:ketosteroid isomerase-like protein
MRHSSTLERPPMPSLQPALAALVFGAALLISCASAAQSTLPGQRAEAELRAVVQAWLAALVRSDTIALYRIIGVDYRNTTSSGTVLNREQDLAPVVDGSVTFATATADEVDVHVFRDAAVVTGRAQFVGTYKNRPFNSAERFTDVYVRRDGRWQVILGHSTAIPLAKKD